MFSKGGYKKTEPTQEFKVMENTYGDGSKTFQVLEFTWTGYVQRGENFKSLEKAKKHLDELLVRRRSATVVNRVQVFP